MLSTHKKIWLKSALAAAIITPTILATVISCSNPPNETTQKPGGPTGSGPVGGGGSVDTPQLPTFVQKQLDQAQNLVINNKTWSKITNLNVERQVQTEEYVTYARRRYHETFKYPAWNWNWENPREGQHGWHDFATDWEYPHPDANGNSQFGKPVQIQALDGAKILREERTDFEIDKDSQGKPVFAKYNDPRFILDEIKNNRLKKHPAADGWFKQKISNETKAITKQFSVPSIATGATATGLYAAPGEVVSLKFSQKTLNEMIKQNFKSFQIIISENYWDNTDIGNPNQSGSVSTRYPWTQTIFRISPEELKANNGIFQFGSPFGGAISIRLNTRMANPTNHVFSKTYQNFDFEISGALEMLSYIDGITTQDDWDAQIQRVKEGKITTPAMSIDLPLLALNIPSTDLNQFAGVNYDQIVFPGEVAKKWNSFMFLTEFLASRDKDYQLDKTGNFTKLFLRFCDDIWINGAGAIAGNNSFAAPISWSANSFLRGLEGWNLFGNNWGVFHEVNHNFEQNGALFSKQSHGTTNQSTMYIMTMLSDNGKQRNLYNPLGQLGGSPTNGWNVRMSSAWNTLNYVNGQVQAGRTGSEYELPTILAFQLGSFNMMQYIRNDAYNGANSHGLDEVIQLSNAFKINLWPAIKQFSKFWPWEDWTNSPTQERQNQLNDIASKYKAVNFVANIFATGAYIYDEAQNQFIYTNDTSAPLLAATNAPYVFDFEKGINSFMDGVKWDQLTFSATTKLGGKVVQDPNNTKRLIYLPPKDVYNQIDEFDVGILPKDQGANFVQEYRWKIKMNLVSNLPVVTMFNDPSTQYINGKGKDFYKEQPYMDKTENYAFQAPIDVRQGIYSDHYKVAANAWQKAKVSFKFVAPEAGEYDFKIKGDSWFFIDVDDAHKADPNQLWWKADSVPSQDFINTQRLNLKKGESVKFDVYLTQKRGANRLNMQAVVNETTYDMFDHITSPFADASEALLGFDYQARQADQNLINHNLVNPVANPLPNLIATDQYIFNLTDDNRPAEITNWLKADDGHKWEVWAKQQNQPITKELIVKFNQAQTIGAIAFAQGNPNWLAAKPTSIIIKDQDGNELYNDRFGKDFNDRNHRTSVINFTKPITNISQLSITLTNTRSVSNGQSAISLDTIQFSPDSFHYLNRIIDSQNPAIKYFGDNWNLLANDVNTNVSQIGTHYATNNAKYQYLEFELNGTGFDVVGQKGVDLGEFDLYVNDQLIGSFDTKNSETINSQILASYRADDWANSQPLKIKIVNRDDKPINIDGFQLYGRNVQL